MRLSKTLFALPFALATGATAVYADGPAGVVVTGEATMQAPLAAQIEGWLKTHGRDVMASPLEPDAINTLVDCFVIEDESCAKGVIEKRAKSETVVFARVDVTAAADGTRDVTLTGYWFAKGHHAVAEKRFCEHCNEDLLRGVADEMMKALAGAGAPDVGHLKLVSNPNHALVMIDGHAVGNTPLDLDVAPGKHELSIAADGHQVEVRTITIRHNDTTTMTVPLLVGHGRHEITEPDGAVDASERPHRNILAPTLVAVGGVGIITGAVLIAVGGAPSKTGKQTATYTDTRPPGIGVLIGGAVVAGVGAFLWTRHHPHSTTAPTASVSADGATFGWAGSF